MLANPDTKNVSGSKLCRQDRGIWAKCTNIWLSWRHVANMLATFSAKPVNVQYVNERWLTFLGMRKRGGREQ